MHGVPLLRFARETQEITPATIQGAGGARLAPARPAPLVSGPKRQFALDDDALEDLKEALLYTHAQVIVDDGRGLVWTGALAPASAPPAAAVRGPVPEASQAPTGLHPSLSGREILTSRSALEGERKQVTVLFADLKGSTELIRDLEPEAAQPSLILPCTG